MPVARCATTQIIPIFSSLILLNQQSDCNARRRHPSHIAAKNDTHEKGRGDKLTREAKVTIAVLVISTFTVILNEMLMAVALPRVMADLAITA